MLLGFNEIIAMIYYSTWFVWPFVFVFSFAKGVSLISKDEETGVKSILMAGIALTVILAGITAPLLHG